MGIASNVSSTPSYKVLFRCGNWCYAGEVSFAGLGDGETINLRDIPRVVPILQRQQDRLKFFCCANRLVESLHVISNVSCASSFRDLALGAWQICKPPQQGFFTPLISTVKVGLDHKMLLPAS